MATLTGNKIKDSYLGLLKSISNGAISSSFVQISDGGGNALPLYLSTSSIKFYNAYTFPSADGTVSGQVLSTDASGTLSWVTSSDNQTLQEVLTQGNTTDLEITTTAQFNGDINGALLQKVIAAEALSKGDVVYISGGTGANPEVSKANASDSTKMPALGIMKENLNNINDEGECITSGELTGVDLTGIATGAELFVSSATAGELVTTAPTGEANLIQKIGKVIKGDSSGGALTVLGAFRTNAVPNLNSAKIFLGNASNQAVSTAISGDATISNTGVIALATVPVTKGGTGATTLTGILLGNNTSAISGITSAVDGHVLTADGVGGYAFEVASGDVSISGTPTQNQVAIWTDGSTIKGMSALEIDVNDKITLDQDASSYNIGGGNIANVTGNYNTGFGLENLNVLTSGYHNTALGYRALKSVTTAVSNVAIGYQSLEFLATTTDHDNNTAVGLSSGRRNNGGNNTFIGFQSGQGSITASNNTGGSNTALGYLSLSKLTSGNSNTGVGTLALEDNTTGLLNTCLGHSSGKDITTGSNNVIIGSNTGSTIATSSNNIIISDGSGNNRIQVDSGGNVGIGTSTIESYWSGYTVLKVGYNNSIFGNTADSVGSAVFISQNLYSDASNYRYVGSGSDEGGLIDLRGGAFVFSNAPLGTAGNVASIVPRLTISSGGNVGIGNTNPSDYDSDANNLVVGSLSGNNGITILSAAASGFGSLYFADGTTVNKVNSGYIRYQQNQSVMSFGVNAAEAMRISLGGVVEIGGISVVTPALLSVRKNGTCIEYGHGNNNGRYEGTLGAFGSAGYPYVGFSTSCDNGANTFTTRGWKGNVINSNDQGDLIFSQATNANASLQALTERMRITSGGQINMGTSTNYHQFEPESDMDFSFIMNAGQINASPNYTIKSSTSGAAITSRLQLIGSTGNMTITGSLTQNGSISDISLKENIKPIKNALDKVEKLNAVTFDWKKSDSILQLKEDYGFIAQEVEKVIPEIVRTNDDDKKAINYNGITSVLVKAIQEQQTIIEDLKSRIETLEG